MRECEREEVDTIAEEIGREFGVPDAGHSGIKVSILAVTSMHICARIFAWAWDFLVGGASYPMQHVSTSRYSIFLFQVLTFFMACWNFSSNDLW